VGTCVNPASPAEFWHRAAGDENTSKAPAIAKRARLSDLDRVIAQPPPDKSLYSS
jgi:hypothetical protein